LLTQVRVDADLLPCEARAHLGQALAHLYEAKAVVEERSGEKDADEAVLSA
jgi:hypothetical protein